MTYKDEFGKLCIENKIDIDKLGYEKLEVINEDNYFKPLILQIKDFINQDKEDIVFSVKDIKIYAKKKEFKKKPKQITGKVFNNKIYQAELFIKDNPLFYDKHKLWWLWNKEKFKYEMVDEVDILNLIEEQTNIDIIKSTERNEIVNALKQKGRLNIPKDAKESWVQFKNKIYDITTEEVFDATPEYFITNPVNLNLGKSEETRALDILFESWVGKEHVQELYELLAFGLVPCYFIHRIFCLIGSGANGKSTFLRVLEKFLCEENITSSSLILLLKTRFEGSKLLKKLVCLMGETHFDMISNTDFLKKVTGQDLVRAEFKGKDGFDFRNYAKLIIATNSLPPTADKTTGFYRRWKILEFPNKFDKETDVLFNVSDEEYENLALKCLNLAKKLWRERLFTNDGDFEERKKNYEEKSNPLMKFIKEKYERNIDSETFFQEFFEDLNNYLEERGYRTLSAIVVSRQIKAEGFDIKSLSKEGKNGRFILGLKTKD